jgi:protease-4
MFKQIGNALKWMGEHFKGLLFLLILLLVFMPNSETPLQKANLQEIKLFGPIMDAEKILKEIDGAKKDEDIKGVLLNVNSPGGSVPPSIEISYAIRELQKKKPVIAYASGIMASGSYYSSIYAGKIIANPGAIVGSIGVIMESGNIKELMDKIGIKPQLVKQGTYKEAGTPTSEWTPQEREELERLTKDTYDLFVSDVAMARGLDINASGTYADAHIFLAQRAKEAGLIDAVGIISEAKPELAKTAKVKKPVWKKKDRLESLMEEFSSKALLRIQSYFYGLKAQL